MEISNVYEYLNNSSYDAHAIKTNTFILAPYQVIPKFYLLSNPDITKLILSFSMGAGKSATAVYTLLYNLSIYRMYKFNEQFATFGSKFFENHAINKNVMVVGVWQTKSQFEVELMRPEFSIIEEWKIQQIEKLLSSPLPEKREEGKLMRKKIIGQIDKDIRFFGYQSFFNAVFPDVQSESYNQNILTLIQEYNRGNLKISQTFLNSAKNNIIIVDEMQRLYSSFGLNTFGFAVACVAKVAKEYNIKILFLTGTMINSSLGEIPDILSIMDDRKEFYTREELCKSDVILNNITIDRLTKQGEELSLKILSPCFIYYNQSRNVDEKLNIPNLTSTSKLESSISIPEFAKDKQALIYPKKKNLPQEIHIGNKVISEPGTLQPMIVYAVESEGEQAKRFTEYVKNNLNSYADVEKEETDSSVNIHDAWLPPSSKWSEHGIYESGNALWGKFLSLSNIKKYSILGYEMCNLCLQNAFNNEKTVVYHPKINGFGIRQYGAILQYNGFVKYGANPSSTSICKFCHNEYQKHALPLEERLKIKCCNKFKPICYDMLTGDLDQNERDNITNNIYNNPNNLYGDMIDVMFVSDVAYSGVSLLNTQNLIVLTRIPNISKWKQIFARIIRTRSHALLPHDKQYAKVYTMIVEAPNERKLFKELGNLSYEERYYRQRIILNEDIDTYIKKLSKMCIGETLLNNPSKYVFKENEKQLTSELFVNDLETEIKFIVKRIMFDSNNRIWELNNLLKRIKDPEVSVSFLNLSIIPDDLLINLMIKNKLITLFDYSMNQQQKVLYADIRVNTGNNNNEMNLSTFDFMQLENIDLRKSNINKLMKLLENEKAITNILTLLGKIIKLVGKKYSTLQPYKIFWDTMFDIGNEFYEDDEANFITNHCRKNRNRSKMVGCYYGQEIILKNGTSKFINYSFPLMSQLKDLPYRFKISCLSFSDSSPFYIHVSVIRISEGKNEDKRKESKGLVCTSMNVNELHPYFPRIDVKLHKKTYCSQLMFEICELQEQHKDIKFVYTPFEK